MKWSVALLLLTPALVGCLGGGDDGLAPSATPGDAPAAIPSDPLHEVAEMLPFEVTAEDGTALRGHIYLPNGSGPFATVLQYSPYWNTAYGLSDEWIEDDDGRDTLRWWLSDFMDAGFAVALVNMRGTGLSEGCLQWGHPTSWSDAGLVIETLANATWSNGNIGMIGVSYDGWSQYMAIASQAPSLKAVIPMSGVIDPYGLTIYDGAAMNQHAALTPLWIAGTGMGGFAALGLAAGDPFIPTTSPDHAACPRYGEDAQESVLPLLDGDRLPYHEVRDLRPAIANTTVPILVTNGMTNGEGHMFQFDGLWELIPHDEKRMLVGQWPHAYPLQDWERFNKNYALPWFDHYLRDGPKTLDTGVVEYQDDTDRWHATETWPPEGNATTLHLSGDILTSEAEAVEASAQSFTGTDWRPLPDACTQDKAVYVSPPLAEEVLLAGYFHANLTVSSTLPDGNFVTHLWHTDELLACGAWADEASTDDAEHLEVARGFSDLRHRGHLDHGRDYPVGQPDVMRMTSEPHASLVPAGHRLVLTVGGGDWQLAPDPRKPMLTVHTGPNIEGELVLNVVERNLSFVDSSGAGAGIVAEVGP